ncbi:MAG: hypothetical protein Q4G23_07325 [Clostridia bacterium]|nr:hypothetical protein [Clostridia bacterium]
MKNNKGAAKKKAFVIWILVLAIAVVVVWANIPTAEERILAFVQDGQYAEALNYISQEGIEGIEDGERKEEIKLALFGNFEILTDTVITGETPVEKGSKAYELGEKLFLREMQNNEAAEKLRKSVGIAEDAERVGALLESGKYADAFGVAVASEHLADGTYIGIIKEMLSKIDKESVNKNLEAEIDSFMAASGFARVPNFLEAETDILEDFISEADKETYIRKIEVSNLEKTCEASGCKNLKNTGKNYCSSHVCKSAGCDSFAANGYCYSHICKASGCNGAALSGGSYCSNHTCGESDCLNYAANGYCYSHTCKASGCNNRSYEGGSYCISHTCSSYSCYNYASDDYCSAHKCIKQGCDDERESGSSYCDSHQPSSGSTYSGGSSYSGAFTNKYGSRTTICAHYGCNNYIASSGDTNCCTTHSMRCGNCGCYIDEDALYCMRCLEIAIRGY